MKDILKFIIFIILMIFIIPWLSFWFAYFMGWICKLVIGQQLITGLALLGITLPVDKIPLLAGTLGWIGGYFKVIHYNTSK